MNRRNIAIALIAALVLGAGGFGLWRLGMSQGMRMVGPAQTAAANGAQRAGDIDPSNGKRVLYWHDPMTPAQRFDKPGKSPFMDMQLVPVYAEGGAGAGEGGVAISPRVEQNLGIRTAPVAVGSIAPRIEAVGNVAFNERDLAVVQARANGFLEKLYVRAPLDPVRKGQALAELYVPDWIAAQEEFLAARRIGSSAGLDALKEGAVQRMRLAGMDEAQIRLVERTGKVQPRLTLVAPIAGVVSELSARDGMTVMAGAPLFRINGLSTIWVNAEVPETFAGAVRPGAPVRARAQAFPGKVFEGKVGAILPEVNTATRTLKTRIELANPRRELVPGMFVTVDFAPAAHEDVLLVPSEAVIPTGRRTVAIVAEKGADGAQRMRPVDVVTGAEANGMTEIRKGLSRGETVVVSGQFLIDSEANLKASAERLAGPADAASSTSSSATSPAASSAASSHGAQTHGGAKAAEVHPAEGRVEKIARDSITISHGAIPSLNWPPMTMGFRPPKEGLPNDVKEGSRVRFAIRAEPDGQFAITSISAEPTPGERK